MWKCGVKIIQEIAVMPVLGRHFLAAGMALRALVNPGRLGSILCQFQILTDTFYCSPANFLRLHKINVGPARAVTSLAADVNACPRGVKRISLRNIVLL